MQIEWKLTLDGIATVAATLIAALFGFGAVLLQIRSSSRQLRKQMADQHGAVVEERERQKRSLAKALLFEIDGFYTQYLQKRRILTGIVDHRDSGTRVINWSVFLEPTFTVYQTAAGNLGLLDDVTTSAIVRWYGLATSYLAMQRRYDSAQATIVQQANPLIEKDLVKELARTINVAAEQLLMIGYATCDRLSRITGVNFEPSTVFIAAARDEVKRFESLSASSPAGRQQDPTTYLPKL